VDELRVCHKCGDPHLLTEFARKADCEGGRAWTCRLCKNANQRARRAVSSNAHTKRYEKTPDGFLMRAYRNMKSRITGVQKREFHLYKGLSLLPKQEFYEWARSNPEFWRLFKLWVKSDYNRKLTPSVNRIDPDDGYVLGNIEWVTHSINSGLARHRTDAAFQRIHDAIAA
jgi:hypothetical protein